MESLFIAPSYQEDPVYYNDIRVEYLDALYKRRDYATLLSCRKPTLDEYDEVAP